MKYFHHSAFSNSFFRTPFFISVIVFFSIQISAQTLVFHESFDGVNGADSVTSNPVSAWTTSSIFFVSPNSSDSSSVIQNDTSALITDAFSTLGNTNVVLTFDQICKIEFFDAAEIFVSTDGGLTWTKLTAPQYLGSGQFGTFNNKFTAASYAVLWSASNGYITPQNSWWKHEIFDISSLAANSSNVKIKFQLSDGNANGASGNYGWLLDNINVVAAPGELIPPVISMVNPILEDSVFFTGPFNVFADITDASGIDTAMLIYKRNANSFDTIGMINASGNVYFAQIDTLTPFSVGDSLEYYIVAIDNSPVHNKSRYPFNSTYKFSIFTSPPPPGCVTPITQYPYNQDFETGFIVGSGTPSSPGTLPPFWTRLPSGGSNYMWMVKAGSTPSSGTGPSGDHTSGNGVFLYAEGSYGAYQSQALLLMPCADINQIQVPYLEFYYHMFGSDVGELHVDIYYGGSWVLDIMPPIVGNQNNAWHKASINLSQFKSTTQIRFRAIRGNSFYSDIAIDDIKIWQPPAYDAGMLSVDAPLSPSPVGLQDVHMSFKNYGSEILNKTTVNWSVNQVLQTPYTWTGTLLPGNSADSINIGQVNFVSGPTTIKAWTSSPNDSNDAIASNDTIQNSIIACSGPLHGVFQIGGANQDFSNFSEALFAIENCGIDSAIVFNVAPGEYIEQLDIDSISGASAVNTITFQSINGDSTSVNLKFSSLNSIDNYVVRFNGAKYITFKGITVQAISTSYGRVFVYDNAASFITVENCRVYMNYAASSYFSGFYFNNTISNNNKIINNDILHGYYSIYMRSPGSSTPGNRNEIRNNNFHGYYSYGAYLQYQDSLILDGNTFANDTTTSFTYGVYIYYAGGKFEIVNNNINSHGSSSVYGLRLYYCDGLSSNSAGLVANNMVNVTGAASYPYGVYCYNNNHVNYYHNTVNVSTQTNSANSRVFYLSSGSDIKIKNNIFSNLSGGYTYYVTSTSAVIESDYNNLFSTGALLSYWLGDNANLSALQSASNKESNSISQLPVFASNNNLHMANGLMNFLGTPIPQVPTDIDGEPRSTVAPALGADEKPPIPIDAGVLSVLSPLNPQAQNDTVPVTIVVKNYGTDTLPAFDYTYSINSLAGPIQSHAAGLLPGDIDTLSFPNIVISPGHNNVCANTILSADTNTYNDQKCKYFYGTPIVDMGISEIVTPDSGMCYTSAEMFIVKIKNYGSQALNMATNNVTIHSTVTGINTLSVPDKIITAGIIQPNQEMNVVIINNLNLGTTGQYEFNVWTSVNQDGDPTNDSVETKVIDVFSTITTLPYYQDFENFIPSTTTNDPGTIGEGWTIYNNSTDYEWYVGNGTTYTTNTGPSVDHTTGSASGKYMYAEAKGYSPTYAIFTSPCINISAYSNPTLKFWYHMYGANINSLKVDVLANGVWHSSAGNIMGHQQNASTDPWEQAVVNLSGYTGTIRFRFRAIKSSSYSADIAIDDISVVNTLPHDAGVSANFVLPNVNFAMSNTLVPVKIKIENLGLDTLTHLNVGYNAGNALPVLESWTGTILPFESDIYEFNTQLSAPVGEVSLCAYTQLSNDNDNTNDTSCMNFTGVPVLPLPYVDDFEGAGYLVSSGGNMQWQKGTPNKAIFNSAHSGNNAWVTSLNTNYLNASNDYLYTPFLDFSQVPNCKMSFYHRIDSETSSDGGFVQYSVDMGQTWVNLGYMGDPLATGWYNSNIGGTHSWSGPDSNWRYSTYDLSAFSTYSSPVQFRFGFLSDASVNNYEGWMIDDFSITPPAIANDAGISAVLTPANYTVPATSNVIKVRIYNYGSQSLNSIPVSYQIDNNAVVNENWTGNLTPGNFSDYTFSTPYTSTPTYKIKVKTNLIGDTHGFNDTLTVFIDKDAALTSVLLPQNVEAIGDSTQVAIAVTNNGTDTITSLSLEYDINTLGLVQENWTGSLPPKNNLVYYFNKYYHVNMGINKICARVNLNGDTKSSNNESCKYVTGVVAVKSINKNNYYLEQNTPNPFSNNTIIRFYLPYSKAVVLNIYDIYGRLVQSADIKAYKGLNSYKFNSYNLSSGIYFYELNFDNNLLRRKMIIGK
jgi:hypothetical protein